MGKLCNEGVRRQDMAMALARQQRAVANAFAGIGFYSDADRLGTFETRAMQETLIQIKVMAKGQMVLGLCKQIEEGGLLCPDDNSQDAQEHYVLGLSYANRILAIPNVDMKPTTHHVKGLVQKALALTLIRYF